MAGARTLVWFSALAVLGLVLLALSTIGPAGRVEERLATAIDEPVGILGDLARPVAQVVLRAGQLRELSEENALLRGEVARLQGEVAALRERQTYVRQADALLAATGAAAGEYLPAAVVLRDPSPGRQIIVIDRGAQDGVKPGQPVVTSGATLAGVVVEAGEHRSRVRLVIDRDSAVAAVEQSSRTDGSLVGTGEGLRLDFVPKGSGVSTGDLIITSAVGGQLPAGLLVGRVSEAYARPQDLFATVTVEPLADFLRLEHVLVMTDFAPAADIELADERIAPGALDAAREGDAEPEATEGGTAP